MRSNHRLGKNILQEQSTKNYADTLEKKNTITDNHYKFSNVLHEIQHR